MLVQRSVRGLVTLKTAIAEAAVGRLLLLLVYVAAEIGVRLLWVLLLLQEVRLVHEVVVTSIVIWKVTRSVLLLRILWLLLWWLLLLTVERIHILCLCFVRHPRTFDGVAPSAAAGSLLFPHWHSPSSRGHWLSTAQVVAGHGQQQRLHCKIRENIYLSKIEGCHRARSSLKYRENYLHTITNYTRAQCEIQLNTARVEQSLCIPHT